MKYPINVEKYIAAMGQEYGFYKSAEEAHREFIPFVNEAYEAGVKGECGFPLDVDELLPECAEFLGKPLEVLRDNLLIPLLIQWANEAYAQGQRDALSGGISVCPAQI